MENKIDRQFLFNYFEGRATVVQKQRLDSWVKERDNQEFFYKVLHEWEMQNIQCDADEQEAMHKYQRRVHEFMLHSSSKTQESYTNEARISKILRLKWPFIAAAVITIICTTVIYWQKDVIRYKTYITKSNEVKTFILTDSSKVTLYANSKLLVPRFDFERGVRKVQLEGNAEFSVKRTSSSQQFIVSTPKEVDIVVLGTVFNVYANTNSTKVQLNEGSVQLHYKEGIDNKQVLMSPGEIATLHENQPVVIKKAIEEIDSQDGEEKKIVFEEAALAQVVAVLHDKYDISIQLADTSLMNLTVTGSFTVADAHELLNLLVEGAGLKLYSSKEGDMIIAAQ